MHLEKGSLYRKLGVCVERYGQDWPLQTAWLALGPYKQDGDACGEWPSTELTKLHSYSVEQLGQTGIK